MSAAAWACRKNLKTTQSRERNTSALRLRDNAGRQLKAGSGMRKPRSDCIAPKVRCA
jgi:hypothetical protein